MASNKYQSNQLKNILKELQKKQTSGTLHIKAEINPKLKLRNCLLILKQGCLVYAGKKIPKPEELIKKIIQKFKPSMVNSAFNFATEKATNKDSIQELLRILVNSKVLTWEQIESFTHNQVISVLESILSYPGEITFDSNKIFDLSFGEDERCLDWSRIELTLNQRQQQWQFLAPTIPSMEAIPQIPASGLTRITDGNVRQHLEKWVNGTNSLIDIAEGMDKDLLSIARSYFKWVEQNWVEFKQQTPNKDISESSSSTPSKSKNLETILSVDDSPIVQATIKRALADDYNILLASNAIEALNILNQQKVDLLLLDVTMPEINGLDMCRTLRTIPKFRDLPIVMVTARDTLIDKLKGQIAGTNRYLTKPFDREKLLQIIQEFL